jgi:hypothetical protein
MENSILFLLRIAVYPLLTVREIFGSCKIAFCKSKEGVWRCDFIHFTKSISLLSYGLFPVAWFLMDIVCVNALQLNMDYFWSSSSSIEVYSDTVNP